MNGGGPGPQEATGTRVPKVAPQKDYFAAFGRSTLLYLSSTRWITELGLSSTSGPGILFGCVCLFRKPEIRDTYHCALHQNCNPGRNI